MRRTRTWTRNLLIGAFVTVTSLAISACCKDDKTETTTEAPPTAEPVASPAEQPAEPIANDPEWKTKCPDAERPESGTVTALRSLQVYKEPKTESDKISTIIPGTWVNLLGAKGTWYCIDYPCDVGKLCPGWIEARYSRRKEPEPDAGIVDAGDKKDAAITDGGGRRIPIPNIRVKDASAPPPKDTGTGKTPPGKRPPGPGAIPQPK